MPGFPGNLAAFSRSFSSSDRSSSSHRRGLLVPGEGRQPGPSSPSQGLRCPATPFRSVFAFKGCCLPAGLAVRPRGSVGCCLLLLQLPKGHTVSRVCALAHLSLEGLPHPPQIPRQSWGPLTCSGHLKMTLVSSPRCPTHCARVTGSPPRQSLSPPVPLKTGASLRHHSCHSLHRFWKCFFVRIFTRCDQKYGNCGCQGPPDRKQPYKTTTLYLSTLVTGPSDPWLFPKVKMTMKSKCFKSIQDIEAAMITKQNRLSEVLLNSMVQLIQCSI